MRQHHLLSLFTSLEGDTDRQTYQVVYLTGILHLKPRTQYLNQPLCYQDPDTSPGVSPSSSSLTAPTKPPEPPLTKPHPLPPSHPLKVASPEKQNDKLPRPLRRAPQTLAQTIFRSVQLSLIRADITRYECHTLMTPIRLPNFECDPRVRAATGQELYAELLLAAPTRNHVSFLHTTASYRMRETVNFIANLSSIDHIDRYTTGKARRDPVEAVLMNMPLLYKVALDNVSLDEDVCWREIVWVVDTPPIRDDGVVQSQLPEYRRKKAEVISEYQKNFDKYFVNLAALLLPDNPDARSDGPGGTGAGSRRDGGGYGGGSGKGGGGGDFGELDGDDDDDDNDRPDNPVLADIFPEAPKKSPIKKKKTTLRLPKKLALDTIAEGDVIPAKKPAPTPKKPPTKRKPLSDDELSSSLTDYDPDYEEVEVDDVEILDSLEESDAEFTDDERKRKKTKRVVNYDSEDSEDEEDEEEEEEEYDSYPCEGETATGRPCRNKIWTTSDGVKLCPLHIEPAPKGKKGSSNKSSKKVSQVFMCLIGVGQVILDQEFGGGEFLNAADATDATNATDAAVQCRAEIGMQRISKKLGVDMVSSGNVEMSPRVFDNNRRDCSEIFEAAPVAVVALLTLTWYSTLTAEASQAEHHGTAQSGPTVYCCYSALLWVQPAIFIASKTSRPWFAEPESLRSACILLHLSCIDASKLCAAK
ncbi:hypothetical protein HYALB_00003339 [Hymenoscyphus albidus]|uniref:Uncharacterized protein n=1 Tax=Hymenoscyphus albidus TaxID=595503 RepID=A0A9N9LNS7_9HELO|nr:hypothetical protein HYALB_00003339 [Hymenoscyphus albidus]